MFNRKRSPNRVEFRERVAQIKLGFGCMDCGWRESVEALEFDHIGDNKVASVSQLAVTAEDWRTVVDEMLKCEVVCVRCHRIRTVARQRQRVTRPAKTVAAYLLEQMQALVERAERAATVVQQAAEQRSPRPLPQATAEAVPSPDTMTLFDMPTKEAEALFDALLVEMAGEQGCAEIQMGDVDQRFPHRTKSWVSRRLMAMSCGVAVTPPGLTLQRIPNGPAGRYRVTPLNGHHDE